MTFIRTIVTALSLLVLSGVSLAADNYDLLIVNGRIADGSGSPWFRADIAVTGDTIARIAAPGSIPPAQCRRTIDVADMIVSPGFIDIHTHTHDILTDPSAHNYVLQGVTTVLDGNCGGSPLDIGDHLEKAEALDIAINYCTLIGQNSIREKVMGSADRAPTDKELAEMIRIVEQGMKDGAVGLSNGLKYRPAVFAETNEVVELARAAARYGGFYATHMRSEGENVIEAVRETIEIGEQANIPVEISHLKVLSVERWGASVEIIRLIDEARKRGIDITADQYPYTASSTGLTVLFPAWAFEGSGWKDKIRDPATKEKIKEGIIDAIVHERAGNDINRIRIARFEADTSLEGLGLGDILERYGRDNTLDNAAELVIELALKGSSSAVYHAISEHDIARIMRHPAVMHASDGHVTVMGEGVPHPRCYGTFPRVLAEYVRKRRIITLEEAIHKMTALPARKIGIRDAGLIAEGMRADLTVFDPDIIGDTATFSQPHSYPEGIAYVIVNGDITVDHGKITEKRAGKVLYGPGFERQP